MRKWGKDCVPVIQQDLSQEETVLQIAFALDALETVANNIFHHVNSNLQRGRSRLESLQRRYSTAEAKIQKITGINKSIKVISSNKYPVNDGEFSFSYEPATIKRRGSEQVCKPLSPDKMSLKEKLKFYHLKQPQPDTSEDVTVGLGNVPDNLKSISSLILFNTNINAYENYEYTDPLRPKQKPSVLQELYKETLLVEPAPSSIDSHFDWLNFRPQVEFFYSPSQPVLPDLDAPLNLPDLPGIAGDLKFSFEPAETEVKKEIVEVDEEIVVDLPKLDVSKPEVSRSEPAPPPPPPPPVPVAPPAPIPPPPPVCPPPLVDSAAPSVPPVTDSRANLMEAIRKAGGITTLKPISKRDPVEPKPEKKPAGNSLMSELHDKLSWRRKGISGKFDPEGGGIMSKIGALIPAPPARPPEPQTDDDDWDD